MGLGHSRLAWHRVMLMFCLPSASAQKYPTTLAQKHREKYTRLSHVTHAQLLVCELRGRERDDWKTSFAFLPLSLLCDVWVEEADDGAIAADIAGEETGSAVTLSPMLYTRLCNYAISLPYAKPLKLKSLLNVFFKGKTSI